MAVSRTPAASTTTPSTSFRFRRRVGRTRMRSSVQRTVPSSPAERSPKLPTSSQSRYVRGTCSARSRTVRIPSRASRSATFGPTPASTSTGASTSGRRRRAISSTASGTTPAKPAGTARVLTERASALPAWRRVRTSRFAVPVVQLLEAGHEADAAEIHLAGAGVVGDVVRLARAVREVREPALAGAERVGDSRAGPPGDDASRRYPMLVLAEEQRPLAVEHDEDLLLGRVAMGRPAQAAGLEDDVAQAGRNGARGAGEIPLEPRIAGPVVG